MVLNAARDHMAACVSTDELPSITDNPSSEAFRSIGESFGNTERESAACALSVLISKADRKLDTEGWLDRVCACASRVRMTSN